VPVECLGNQPTVAGGRGDHALSRSPARHGLLVTSAPGEHHPRARRILLSHGELRQDGQFVCLQSTAAWSDFLFSLALPRQAALARIH